MSSNNGWKGKAITAITVVVALLFVAAGGAKLVQAEAELKVFAHFEIPVYLMLMAGMAEVAAAVLLVVPRTTSLGGVIGVAVMSNAIAAHLHVGEYPQAIVPLVVAGLCITAGWARRANLANWLSQS